MEISFARMPRRCKPSHVRLTIDVNADTLAPTTEVYPIERTRRPLIVELAERVAAADVLHASSIVPSGASSDSVGVLIGR